MEKDTQTLQDILVANVLILSKLLDADKREHGTHRMGGDYSREAIEMIRKSRSAVLTQLLSQ